MATIKAILAKARWVQLHKSAKRSAVDLVLQPGAKAKANAPTAKPKAASKAKPVATVGGHVQIQRPDHPEPRTVRVLSAGKHGIRGVDPDGIVHTVRHQHIINHGPAVDSETRVLLARSAHDRGYVTDAHERLVYTDHQRKPIPQATAAQRALLASLQAYGVPVRPDSLEGPLSAKDAQALIDAYVRDPLGRITTAK